MLGITVHRYGFGCVVAAKFKIQHLISVTFTNGMENLGVWKFWRLAQSAQGKH
jgi:hypothetical protein